MHGLPVRLANWHTTRISLSLKQPFKNE